MIAGNSVTPRLHGEDMWWSYGLEDLQREKERGSICHSRGRLKKHHGCVHPWQCDEKGWTLHYTIRYSLLHHANRRSFPLNVVPASKSAAATMYNKSFSQSFSFFPSTFFSCLHFFVSPVPTLSLFWISPRCPYRVTGQREQTLINVPEYFCIWFNQHLKLLSSKSNFLRKILRIF